MRLRYTAFLFALPVLASACGGDAATTTAAAATSAAAVEATAPAAGAAGGSASALSERCAELWGEYVRMIEPIVADVDWTDVAAAQASFAAIVPALEAAVAPLDAQFDAEGCNSLEAIDPATEAQLLEITSAEAPGAVAFVQFALIASSEMSS